MDDIIINRDEATLIIRLYEHWNELKPAEWAAIDEMIRRLQIICKIKPADKR